MAPPARAPPARCPHVAAPPPAPEVRLRVRRAAAPLKAEPAAGDGGGGRGPAGQVPEAGPGVLQGTVCSANGSHRRPLAAPASPPAALSALADGSYAPKGCFSERRRPSRSSRGLPGPARSLPCPEPALPCSREQAALPCPTPLPLRSSGGQSSPARAPAERGSWSGLKRCFLWRCEVFGPQRLLLLEGEVNADWDRQGR